MKLRIKPKPLQRWLHDLYAGLPSGLIPQVEAVSDAAAIPDAERIVVQTAGRMELPHPLEAAFHGPEYARSEITWPEATALRLRNLHLVGDQGCVYLADGRRLEGRQAVWNGGARKVRRPIRRFASDVAAPIFHLTGNNHENRAHFVAEHLPRFFAARSAIALLPELFLIPPGHRHWQAQYLNLLGVEEPRLVEGTPGTLRVAELLLVPFLCGSMPFGAPAMIRAMSSEMQLRAQQVGWLPPSTSIARTTQGSVLWISRRDAPDRQLDNEEILVETARRLLGEVEVVQLSKLSLPEQVARLGRCQWIIGGQGQGLHLPILASGKQLIILEQGHPNLDNGWDAAFRNLAELAGNRAVRLFSGCPPAKHVRGHWHFPDAKFATDIGRLLRVRDTLPSDVP